MTLPIALQLYTVREPLKKDFAGTLKAVADIGYRCVELAGLPGGTSPQAARQTLDDLGLDAVAAHVPLDALLSDAPLVMDQAVALGYRHVVCPFLPDDLRDAEGYRQIAERLSGVQSELDDERITLSYHNHAFEFDDLGDGTTGYEILTGQTMADQLQFELDLYWVVKGGQDPTDWMDALKGRLPLLHIKDMADTADRGFAEVGTGTIDLVSLATKAPDYGVEYLIIEQDNGWIDGDPLKSAKLSYDNFTEAMG